MPAKTGKPKLTGELADKVMELLETGLYRNQVASLVGITEVTFSKWMASKREPYRAFAERVVKAEAEAERRQLAKITSSPETTDAKWYLSRKHPDRWAETRRVDVSGRLEMGMKVDINAFADDEARAAILKLTEYLYSDSDDGTNGAGENSDESEVS